jgi:hypothetical protein
VRLRLFHHTSHASCEVTLSRRNLLALLQKLEMEGSARTLISDNCPPGLELVVRAEDDEEHYAERAEPPGPMHPRTEAFIREREQQASGNDQLQDPDQQELPEGVARPDPGHFHHQILAQGEIWFDRFGRLHRLEEMPLDYLFNVMRFLERQGPKLHLTELLIEIPQRLAGVYEEKDLSALEAEGPREWLQSTPLMRALAAQAESRLSQSSSERRPDA